MASGVVPNSYLVSCERGIIVSGVVLTAAPVDAEPRPETAIALVRWLRTACAGSTAPAARGVVETTAPVAWAPLMAPPVVET